MSDYNKTANNQDKKKTIRKPQKENQQRTGYISWWLFRTKGTVAEPWPTAEELRKDENVQREVKTVREAFNHIRGEPNS